MIEQKVADQILNERVANIPRNLHAMRQAVCEALLQHKRAGNPVAVWRNGRVEWIPPQDIPLDDLPGPVAE
ncbi:MAG: hypothetical protein HW416_1764 [Chloroflexi bacterium]|nr:hypothetical protein [Chloroflexota bacterium]